MKKVSKELQEILICAKYLYLNGCTVMLKSEPFSDGIALLSFQDSVEMTLRVIAEYLECTIKDNTPFNKIMDQIESKSTIELPCRSSFLQMNKARVNFKHYGLEPKRSATEKFRNDLDEYYPRLYKDFLAIDYNSITLISLVQHRRTENYLRKSQLNLEDDDYGESVRNSAIAFEIYAKHIEDSRSSRRITFPGFRNSEIEDLAGRVEEELQSIRKYLAIIAHEINLSEYRRFIQYTPYVFKSDSGKIVQTHYPFIGDHIEPTKEIARFCHDFVIRAALTIRKNIIRDESLLEKSTRTFKVCKRSAVRVLYEMDSEIIRFAEPGEILSACDSREDRHEFTAVIQDGDIAYILSKDLQRNDIDSGSS